MTEATGSEACLPFLPFLSFFLDAGTNSSFSQSGTSAMTGGGAGSSCAAPSSPPFLGFFLFFFALPAGTKSSFSQSSASALGAAGFDFCFCFCAALPPLLFFFLLALDAGTKSSFSQSSASPARTGLGAARGAGRRAEGAIRPAREPTAPRKPVPALAPAGAVRTAGAEAIAAPANMSTVSHPVSRVKCRKRNRTFGDVCAAVRRNGRPRAADKALSWSHRIFRDPLEKRSLLNLLPPNCLPICI